MAFRPLFRLTIMNLIFLITGTLLLAGCAAPILVEGTKTGRDKLQMLSGDKARIFIRREKSIVGAAVPHYVVDAGDRVDTNVFILEARAVAPDTGNFYLSNQVKLWAIVHHDMLKPGENISRIRLPYIQILTGQKEDSLKVMRRDIQRAIDDSSYLATLASDEYAKSVGEIAGTLTKSHAHVSSARFAGTIKSGKTLVWDRNPGTMRIKIVQPNGEEIIAPPLMVEAGKTYYILFRYTKSVFEISETPFGR